jgi:hypothetical protein
MNTQAYVKLQDCKRIQCHCRMHLLTEIASLRSKLCHLQNEDECKCTVPTGSGV